MSRVIFSPWARADLKGIGGHIAQHDPSAAQKWVTKLRDVCKTTIGMFPECGTRCDHLLPTMRRFSVGSYLIYFKGRSPVRILRVVHGAMNEDDLRFE